MFKISAKLGTGIPAVLDRVIEQITPPQVDRNPPFRALIFDSRFDKYRGALNLIYVLNGSLKVGHEIQSMITKKSYPVKGITILRPKEDPIETM